MSDKVADLIRLNRREVDLLEELHVIREQRAALVRSMSAQGEPVMFAAGATPHKIGDAETARLQVPGDQTVAWAPVADTLARMRKPIPCPGDVCREMKPHVHLADGSVHTRD